MDLRFRTPLVREGHRAPGNRLPAIAFADGGDGVADLEAWLRHHPERIQARLLEHGAVLFRGFAVRDATDFERVARAVEPELADAHEFDGPAPRRWHTRHVCEALDHTVTSNRALLTLHNENSFLTRHPGLVMLCCLEPPPRGGETPLVDCRAVYRDLPQSLRERVRGRTFESAITLPGATVIENFGTPDRAAIESKCEAHGVHHVHWWPDGSLTFRSTVPLVIHHPATSDRIWFNRIHQMFPGSGRVELPIAALLARCRVEPRALAGLARFGLSAMKRRLRQGAFFPAVPATQLDDGTYVSTRDQIRIMVALWRNAAVLRWRRGDVLVVDNRLVAHGRMPHRGRREILFCMGPSGFVEPES